MGSSEVWLWVCLAAPMCSYVLGGGTDHDFIMFISAKSILFVLLGHWCVGDVGRNMPSKHGGMQDVDGGKKQKKEKRVVRHPSMH